jgi:hypothetical protein
MKEAYDACKDATGKGFKEFRITTLQTHLKLLGEKSPFARAIKEMGRGFVEIVGEQCRVLQDGVESDVQDIRARAVSAFDNREEDEGEATLIESLQKHLPTILQVQKDVVVTLGMLERKYEVTDLENATEQISMAG